MASIFIYNYNNYYNRKVKKEDALIGYGSPVYTESSTNLNFNPNDGVTTAFVAGRVSNSYNGRGDYLIYSEDNTSITSRWFVLEATRARKGQYNLVLKRDVIVDNYDAVLAGTALIEKGTLSDADPLIYNQEPIPTNQIKTTETELKDDTGIAWIVGYVARNAPAKEISLETSVIVEDSTLESWAYKSYIDTPVYAQPSAYLEFNINAMTYRNMEPTSEFNPLVGTMRWKTSDPAIWLENNKKAVDQNIISYNGLYRRNVPNQSVYNGLLSWKGKILKDSTGNYYRIDIKQSTVKDVQFLTTNKSGEYLSTYLINLFQPRTSTTINGTYFRLTHEYPTVTVSLTKMEYGSYQVSFPAQDGRYHLKDAPYDMFCIPYGDNVKVSIAPYTVTTNKTSAIAIAQQLAVALDANLYDLQLLPYCPLTGYMIYVDGTVSFNDVNTKRYTAIKSGDSVAGLMIWATASSGTKNIILETPLTYTNKKIANQCDMYRLVSPNYNGQFEFNLAKNNTPSLNLFNVDFTYMPYNPYIHINPAFDGLYGQDFNDARGLICGGDFSLARVGSAWEQYQLNNKNYQAIFDRQIQNMDVNRKYQRIEETANIITGTLQGGGVGSILGGVGAGVGAGLSLAGGMADAYLNESKYKESRSYAQDVHNYQLDNIRALPYSLSKTSAFTFNNKVFPILEYYTCTEQEKTAVANEIANTGMTIGIIGNVGDYAFNTWSYENIASRNFIKCRLIRLEDIADDYHMIDDIANELNKGVYFV